MAYRAETKSEALARLWLTAMEVDGEWVPNFQSVEEGMKADPGCESPTRTTVRNWWKQRDRTKDSQFRTLQTETVTAAAERGALKQLEGILGVVVGRLNDMAADGAAWQDPELPLPQKSQAAMNIVRALTLAGPLLQATGQGEKEESGGDRAARYAAAVKRTEASGRTK